MTTFTNSLSEADTLIAKAQKVKKGATKEEADMGYERMAAYAAIARRCRDDMYFGFNSLSEADPLIAKAQKV
jgi:hypothetical protein